MSDVKRYSGGEITAQFPVWHEHTLPSEFVAYTDYLALQQQLIKEQQTTAFINEQLCGAVAAQTARELQVQKDETELQQQLRRIFNLHPDTPYSEVLDEARRLFAVQHDKSCLQQQLAQAQGELREYKDSWRKRTQVEIEHVRESLKIRRVIARSDKYDELLMIIEGGDANNIMVAHPCADLKHRAEHAEARVRELEQERQRDALAGQAALDESNNEIMLLQAKLVAAEAEIVEWQMKLASSVGETIESQSRFTRLDAAVRGNLQIWQEALKIHVEEFGEWKEFGDVGPDSGEKAMTVQDEYRAKIKQLERALAEKEE